MVAKVGLYRCSYLESAENLFRRFCAYSPVHGMFCASRKQLAAKPVFLFLNFIGNMGNRKAIMLWIKGFEKLSVIFSRLMPWVLFGE